MDKQQDPLTHTVPPDRGKWSEQPKWRRDFPIERQPDNYQARRDFTKFLVLTSFAFVVGQFWIGMQNMWRRTRGAPPILRIVTLDELPVGKAVTFRYPSEKDPCLLVRSGPDSLVAYSSLCTHLQCPVLPEVEIGKLHCPCHAGYFDLVTGEVLAGPPRRPLPRILLEQKNNAVYATGIEEEVL